LQQDYPYARLEVELVVVLKAKRSDKRRSRWLSTIRARLYSAFGFAAALTIVGSLIAIYEFTEIGKTTHEIVSRSLPATIVSLRLAEQASDLISSAPQLMVAKDDHKRSEVAKGIGQRAKNLAEGVAHLRTLGVANTAEIDATRSSLVQRLDAINQVVTNRIAISSEREMLTAAIQPAYEALHKALVPAIAAANIDFTSTSKDTIFAGALDQKLDLLRRLSEIDSEANLLAELLTEAALVNDSVRLNVLRDLIRTAKQNIETNLAAVGDPDRRKNFTALYKELGSIESDDGIIAVRIYELKGQSDAAAAFEQVQTATAAFKKAIDGMVDQQGSVAETISQYADRQTQSGKIIMVVLSGVAVICAILLAWLYVGRGVVRRLDQLSDGMRRIAEGNLNVHIQDNRGDEIAEMAQAVGVFRDNAIALAQLLDEREQAAARLEKVVEERTAELQQRSAVLRVTFDNMAHGVLMFDQNNKIAAWNRQVLKLLELPETFLAGEPDFEDFIRFIAKRGEYGAVDVEAEVRRFHSEIGLHRTFERSRPNGTVLEVRHNPLPDGETVIIYTDITERKRYEETLTAARDAADEANRTKSSFLANMSHELRTPLNAIIGYSEILQEDAADKGDQQPIDDLKKIESAGRHLLGLINNILDLSKIESGKMDLFVEPVDIQALIKEVLSIVQPLANKSGNIIEVICPAEIGTFRSDQTKVKQSLLNLISNANKFTSKGKLTLTVGRDNNSRIYFRVTDTGVGMAPDQLGRLFQAFSQADASTTKRFGGTGLGLAITKHFCTMLGGDVTVESTLGKGSTFTIWLPDQGETPVAVEAPAPIAAADDGRATVLVVDDDSSVRNLLGRTLEGEGYRVITASNGIDALTLARQHKPQAITLDVMMPKLDGWGALRALKADAELRDIPVIMVTVLNERGMAIPLGAADFVTKPVDRQRLTTILRDHCANPNNLSILVVEDNQPTREALCRTLASMGYAAHAAVNGRNGLDWLASHPTPSLILLDLMMPEMDGFEFLRELRKQPAYVDVPVIVVTAKDLTADDLRILSGQTQKIIAKDQTYLAELAAAVRGRMTRNAREMERTIN